MSIFAPTLNEKMTQDYVRAGDHIILEAFEIRTSRTHKYDYLQVFKYELVTDERGASHKAPAPTAATPSTFVQEIVDSSAGGDDADDASGSSDDDIP